VTAGGVNATIPSDKTLDTITLAEAIALIDERAAKGGGKPKRGAKKAAPKKAAAKASAKAPAILTRQKPPEAAVKKAPQNRNRKPSARPAHRSLRRRKLPRQSLQPQNACEEERGQGRDK